VVAFGVVADFGGVDDAGLVATPADTVGADAGAVVVVGVLSVLVGAVADRGADAAAVGVADVAGVGATLVTVAVPVAPEADPGVIAGPQNTRVAAIGASSAASFGVSGRRGIKRK
jgi:hypothetical protein